MTSSRLLLRLVANTALVLIGTNCGGSDTGISPDLTPSTSSSIDVGDNLFTPRNTTVPVGTTVTWTWKGSQPHDVTFASGTSSTIKTTGTFGRQFTSAGTYDYICGVHGAAMSGQIVVR